MVAHILGGERSCLHASSEATEKAKELKKKKQKGKRARTDEVEEDVDSTNNSSPAPSKKHKAVDRVVKQQTKLKVFKGISIPFTDEQEKEVHTQFLRATVSANLPYSWVSDPEVIKLLIMFCSCAGDVIPSRKVLAERLLKEEHQRVEEELKSQLEGKKVTLTCNGVKDVSKNSLMGVSVSSEFKPHLVDLYDATAHKKDGDSMEDTFDKMIEKTKKRYKCTVVSLGMDNDGGTRSGHVKVVVQRHPWLLIFPCSAHQGHLSVANYFKVNPDAEETSEQANSINWMTKQVKTYLVASATRWTTHLVAFIRLEDLKQSLRTAAIMRQDDIIAAQVGAEKNLKAAAALTTSAEEQIDLIEDNDFWRKLTAVIEDLEPLAYATNICQSDKACPDCVLLAFHLDWFGPDAGANILNINAMVVELYNKVTSQPPSDELDPYEQDAFQTNQLHRSHAFSAAFLHYCSYTGPFVSWKDLKVNFQEIHGDDPIIFWESMKSDAKVSELAKFALLILHIVMNTAGNERQFSHVKIKKDRLRNRLLLEKLESKLKIGENLREHQYSDGLRDFRKPCQNHSEDRVSKLLQVPRYGELIGGDEGGSSTLVTTQRYWCTELNWWKEDAQRHDELYGDDLDAPLPPLPQGTPRTWLLRSLNLLFGQPIPDTDLERGGTGGTRPRRVQRVVFSDEQLLMELLAQEKDDEILDDGALEGSGNEYDGN
ncbi:hypothetical protein BT96DRAFT_957953 [Gymnopus androsaceus JB14]|uniref:DUF659 domain-containing protein n=1 Tax=Gymnopus androsaceus JB14 TaxID=1447944 RepID=A0A6A4HFL3_9AGAR|nr:hypothetical protein BT96DRAFT_957953 [Gymnopus androsaceus JB14]